MARRYWLMKSEPATFSIQDLARAPKQTTSWDGVRNYQARNLLRDEMKVGDGVLFYHSSADPPAVAGTAEVVRAGHPDPTQFDAKSNHYDPDARPDEPRWYMVDIKYGAAFERPVALPALRAIPALRDMVLLRKGSRLSVQPVTAAEWKTIVGLGDSRLIAARGVHHLAIQVRDLAEVERFYGGPLGLRVLRRWPAGGGGGGERLVWMDTGDGSFLALEAVAAGPTAAEESARGERPGLHLVALRIAAGERSQWEARLAQAGVAIYHRTPFTLYVRDPEGNRVGLSHFPDGAADAGPG